MSHTKNMSEGSPTRDILFFALPLILGYILQQMYLVIDAAIVGRILGVNALAAVGATSSIMFLIMGFCNGTCAGFSIPVAQSFGGGDYSKMRAYVASSIRITIILAFIITLFTAVFCHHILRLVNTPAAIYEDAYTFLLLNFLAIPLTMAYNLLSDFIRALGNSRQPFYFLIFSSLVNILLDFLLIPGFGMGVAGAGLATLLSQGLASLLCLIYIRRRLPMLVPHGSEWEYHDHMTGHLLTFGIPMGLQFSITGIGIIMLQSANNALGTVYVASFTAAMRVKYLFTSVFENIGVAMSTYCGQNLGAGRLDRVGLGVRAAIKIMLVYFGFTLLIIWPFADDMMMLFVSGGEHEIISNAAMYMRISNYFYPVLGLLTIFRYSIQGLGFSNLSMRSGVMEMMARTAVSLWVVPLFGFLGVCYGDPLAWTAADMFLLPAFYFVMRKLRRRQAMARTGA